VPLTTDGLVATVCHRIVNYPVLHTPFLGQSSSRCDSQCSSGCCDHGDVPQGLLLVYPPYHSPTTLPNSPVTLTSLSRHVGDLPQTLMYESWWCSSNSAHPSTQLSSILAAHLDVASGIRARRTKLRHHEQKLHPDDWSHATPKIQVRSYTKTNKQLPEHLLDIWGPDVANNRI
jgi:hypothetical protein